jgi:hypothetical protein
VLSPETVRALAEHDIRVTRALLRETSARVAEYINELETSAFGSLRQRLARHLLGSTRTSIRPEELTKTTPSSRH